MSGLFGRLIFLPLLVLARLGAVPVKISAGNNFPGKYQNSTKLLPVLVINFDEISALHYCTGNF